MAQHLGALLDRPALRRLGGPPGSDHPDHQLVTRYEQNHELAEVAIFVGQIIMSPPSPLSALCTANEVAVVIEAGPEAESFVNANGSDWKQLVGGRGVLETCSIDGALLAKAAYRPDDLERGTPYRAAATRCLKMTQRM